MERVWQIDAHNMTARQAIDAFCRTYWQETRKARLVRPHTDRGFTFRLVDGTRTYWCRAENDRPPVWVVSILQA